MMMMMIGNMAERFTRELFGEECVHRHREDEEC